MEEEYKEKLYEELWDLVNASFYGHYDKLSNVESQLDDIIFRIVDRYLDKDTIKESLELKYENEKLRRDLNNIARAIGDITSILDKGVKNVN